MMRTKIARRINAIDLETAIQIDLSGTGQIISLVQSNMIEALLLRDDKPEKIDAMDSVNGLYDDQRNSCLVHVYELVGRRYKIKHVTFDGTVSIERMPGRSRVEREYLASKRAHKSTSQ